MGFCMDSIGSASIETRRESFILRVDKASGWGDDELYGAIEMSYEDLPYVFEALKAMAYQNGLPWPPELPEMT